MSINSQHEWLEFGRKHGWASQQFCITHDGPPTTAEEDAEWEDGGDPCCFAVRLIEHGEVYEGGREGWPVA